MIPENPPLLQRRWAKNPARNAAPNYISLLLLYRGRLWSRPSEKSSVGPVPARGAFRAHVHGGWVMDVFDFDAFRSTPLTREPFQYLIVPGFLKPAASAAVNADYPRIDSPGSFPIQSLTYGPAFKGLVQALRGPEFRAAFAEKFGVDLRGRPTMITARGRCGPKDGRIHTDSETKIITVLLYMNPSWEEAGGRLRLLRSADDIEDVLAEVPPVEGTLVAFCRSDNSYHGHKPFVGPRRVVQFNWVTSWRVALFENWRHRLSAWLKGARGHGAVSEEAMYGRRKAS